MPAIHSVAALTISGADMDEKVVLVRARVLLMRASVDLMEARKFSLKSKNSSQSRGGGPATHQSR